MMMMLDVSNQDDDFGIHKPPTASSDIPAPDSPGTSEEMTLDTADSTLASIPSATTSMAASGRSTTTARTSVARRDHLADNSFQEPSTIMAPASRQRVTKTQSVTSQSTTGSSHGTHGNNNPNATTPTMDTSHPQLTTDASLNNHGVAVPMPRVLRRQRSTDGTSNNQIMSGSSHHSRGMHRHSAMSLKRNKSMDDSIPSQSTSSSTTRRAGLRGNGDSSHRRHRLRRSNTAEMPPTKTLLEQDDVPALTPLDNNNNDNNMASTTCFSGKEGDLPREGEKTNDKNLWDQEQEAAFTKSLESNTANQNIPAVEDSSLVVGPPSLIQAVTTSTVDTNTSSIASGNTSKDAISKDDGSNTLDTSAARYDYPAKPGLSNSHHHDRRNNHHHADRRSHSNDRDYQDSRGRTYSGDRHDRDSRGRTQSGDDRGYDASNSRRNDKYDENEDDARGRTYSGESRGSRRSRDHDPCYDDYADTRGRTYSGDSPRSNPGSTSRTYSNPNSNTIPGASHHMGDDSEYQRKAAMFGPPSSHRANSGNNRAYSNNSMDRSNTSSATGNSSGYYRRPGLRGPRPNRSSHHNNNVNRSRAGSSSHHSNNNNNNHAGNSVAYSTATNSSNSSNSDRPGPATGTSTLSLISDDGFAHATMEDSINEPLVYWDEVAGEAVITTAAALAGVSSTENADNQALARSSTRSSVETALQRPSDKSSPFDSAFAARNDQKLQERRNESLAAVGVITEPLGGNFEKDAISCASLPPEATNPIMPRPPCPPSAQRPGVAYMDASNRMDESSRRHATKVANFEARAHESLHQLDTNLNYRSNGSSNMNLDMSYSNVSIGLSGSNNHQPSLSTHQEQPRHVPMAPPSYDSRNSNSNRASVPGAHQDNSNYLLEKQLLQEEGPVTAQQARDEDDQYRHVRLLNPPMQRPSQTEQATRHSQHNRSSHQSIRPPSSSSNLRSSLPPPPPLQQQRDNSIRLSSQQPRDNSIRLSPSQPRATRPSFHNNRNSRVAQSMHHISPDSFVVHDDDNNMLDASCRRISNAASGAASSSNFHLPSTFFDEEDEDKKQFSKPKMIWLALICVIMVAFVVVVGCVVGLVVVPNTKDGNDSGKENVATIAPSMPASDSAEGVSTPSSGNKEGTAKTLDEFVDTLPLKTQHFLKEQHAPYPQSKALEFLEMETLFWTLPLWRQQQRFALATINFALYPDDDVSKYPSWFQQDSDECYWVWNPDEPTVCDEESRRYLTLPLRFDHFQDQEATNGNEGAGIVLSSVDANSTATESNATNAATSMASSTLSSLSPSWSMPAEIGLLSLETLIISRLPSSARLQQLWPTDLTGSPSLQQTLTKLEVRYSPELGGTIPSGIGLLSNLEYLYLESTAITGSIPNEVGSLTNMKEFNVILNAYLAGTLPTELGLMKAASLLWVYDSPNLGGPIPSELGLMHEELVFLKLSGNQLTSTIPSELGELTNLHQFRLGHNDLTGTIPSTLGQLQKVRAFELIGNEKLSGTMPEALCSSEHRIGGTLYELDCEQIECCFRDGNEDEHIDELPYQGNHNN